MAKLLEVVTSGILLSHDLSKNNSPTIYEDIEEGSPVPQINIDNLISTVLDYLEKMNSQINEISVVAYDDFPHGNTYGIVEVKNGIAEIVISGKLNKCWERFTIAKELLQLYVDVQSSKPNNHYGNKDIIQQIKDLVVLQDNYMNNLNSTVWMQPFSDKAETELTAIMTTIDLIFPFSEKKEIVRNIADWLKDNQVTPYNVAYAFRMPEFIIKTYYKNWHEISLSMVE